MQSINLILVAVIAALVVPVFLLISSAYSLYSNIDMARYARRRNSAMLRAIARGRKISTKSSQKDHLPHRHPAPKPRPPSDMPPTVGLPGERKGQPPVATNGRGANRSPLAKKSPAPKPVKSAATVRSPMGEFEVKSPGRLHLV